MQQPPSAQPPPNVPEQSVQLQPLDLGSLLETVGRIFFRRVWTLVLIAAVIIVPIQLILAGLQAFAFTTDPVLVGTPERPQIDTGTLIVIVSGAALAALLSWFGTTLVTGAAFRVVALAYAGGEATARGSLRFAARRLGPLIWVSFLTAFLTFLAALALIIPGIWLWISWVVAIPALMTEDVRGMDALRRSFRLVRHRWWPTLGTLILVAILVGIATAIPGAIYQTAAFLFGGDADVSLLFGTAGSIAGAVLSGPFYGVLLGVLYFDLRARKEGLTLDQLRRELGLHDAPADA